MRADLQTRTNPAVVLYYLTAWWERRVADPRHTPAGRRRVDMYFDGLSYRRTAENIGEYFGRSANVATVYRWVQEQTKRASKALALQRDGLRYPVHPRRLPVARTHDTGRHHRVSDGPRAFRQTLPNG